MTDRDLPELPSDEELGIAGLDEEELLGPAPPPSGPPSPSEPPPPPPPRPPPASARPAATVPAGPGGWARGLVTLLVLVLGAWAGSSYRTLPPTVPANAPDSVFASGRALAALVEMARAPRPVGSPEHTRVREAIVERLEELGLDSEIHTSMPLWRSGQTVRAVTLRNIVARIPGTASTGAIVLTAHYDSAPLSAGAGDDASGVVTILEVVRALRASAPLRNDVIVLITDGEEMGLLGARVFVEEHPRMDDVAVVLSVEMRGGGGPSHMFETGPENGWIIRAMRAGDPRPLASSFSLEVYRRMPNDTDFTPFREAGVQGLNFAAIDRARIYHQPTDVPANVEEATLQHHGIRVLGITRELGGRNLRQVHAPDVAYTNLPFVGLVAYPVGWALPISGGILLLWIAVAVLAALRGARWTGVAVGVGVVAAAGGAAAGAGWLLMRWLPRFHPEFGGMTPAFYGEGWYVLGLAATAVAVTTALLGLARGRFSTAALGTGALLVPVGLAVALAALAPLTALTFQGPALAGVLAVAAVAVTVGGGPATAFPAGRPGPAVWILALLLALPVLAFLVPLLEGLWVAMSFRLAAVLGALLVLVLACLVPALAVLGEPNRWWAPAAAVLLAVFAVGTGILQAGPSAERPVHSTLLYALDRETGEGLWATREDPGFGWAEERVGPFIAEDSLANLLALPAAPYRTAPAPVAEIPLPALRPEGPAPEAGPRVFRFALTSGIGAEIVSVRTFEDEAILVAVSGRGLPPASPGSPGARRPVTRIAHQGVPAGDALRLDLDVAEGAEVITFEIVEEHLRAAELLGDAPFRRPPHLMPNPRAGSDRVLVRTVLRVPVDADAVEEEPTEDEDETVPPPVAAFPGGPEIGILSPSNPDNGV
jgi:hypothetical protein